MNVQKQALIVNKLLEAGLDYNHVNSWAAFVVVPDLPNVEMELNEGCFKPDGGVILAELARAAYTRGVEAGKLQMQAEFRSSLINLLGIENLTL